MTTNLETEVDIALPAPGLPGIVEEREVVLLRPLIGFPDLTRFALRDLGPGYAPYQLLVSLDQPGLQFIVVPPGRLFSDYVIEIPDADVTAMALETPEHTEVLTLVTRRASSSPTVNLLGPLVFNRCTGFGAQVVLQDSDYRVAVPIDATSASAE